MKQSLLSNTISASGAPQNPQIKSQSNAVSKRFHKHISKRDYAAYSNLTKSDEDPKDKNGSQAVVMDFA